MMADVDFMQASTKKILALVKNLPDSHEIEASLKGLLAKPPSKRVDKKRFNKHPRKIFEHRDSRSTIQSNSSFIVLKQPPNREVLTDSSDEFCDVTIRKEPIDVIKDEDQLQELISSKKNQGAGNNNNGPSSKQQRSTTNTSNTTTTTNVHWENDAKAQTNNINNNNHNDNGTTNAANEEAGDGDTNSKEKRAQKSAMVKTKPPTPRELPKFYLDKKLEGMIHRSLHVLEDIKLLIEAGVEPPDGQEELQRRKKRTNEFTTRFSRYYLYQLNRQMNELQSMLKPGANVPTNVLLNQKLLTAHQTIFQGLEAYQKHLPTSVTKGVPDKLKELLRSVCCLCKMYKDNCDNNSAGDYIEDVMEVFDVRSKALLEQAEDEEFVSSTRNSLVNAGSSTQLRSAKSMAKPRSKSSRYAMYHSVPVRRDLYWKKAIAFLAKKKFDVPSRYKTATFKHRPQPPAEQPPTPILPIKSKSWAPKIKSKSAYKLSDHPSPSGVHIKARSAKQALNDIDNISTLIEDQLDDNTLHTIMWNLAQSFFQKVSSDNQAMSQTEYECILEHFITMLSDDRKSPLQSPIPSNRIEKEAQLILEEKLGKPIQCMEFTEFVSRLVDLLNQENKSITIPDLKQQSRHNTENDLLRPAFHENGKILSEKDSRISITVTGAPNAQLICIKDDNSLVEPSQDGEEEDLLLPAMTTPRTPKKKSSPKLKRSRQTVQQLQQQQQQQHGSPPAESVDERSELEYICNDLIDIESHNGAGEHKTKMSRVNIGRTTSRLKGRKLEMLSKDVIVRIIEYKLQFHKDTKNNYMYKKSGNMSPWLVMDRVADRLLDEALHSIARDIQVDGILQKIYANEFK